jgi:hypothetical protein
MYIISNCDHAGIWRANLTMFNLIARADVNLKDFLSAVNEEKERLRLLPNGKIFVTGFVQFQYGENLNPRNRVHMSVLDILAENGVEFDGPNKDSIRPQLDPNNGPKDKDKDKDKDIESFRSTLPDTHNTDDFVAAWMEFKDHRREIKKPLTPRAAAMQLKLLFNYDANTAVKMIQKSIASGWQSIYELKGNGYEGQPRTDQRNVSRAGGSTTVTDARRRFDKVYPTPGKG